MIDEIYFLIDMLYDDILTDYQDELLQIIKAKLCQLNTTNEVATFVDNIDYKILMSNISQDFDIDTTDDDDIL